MKTIYYFLLGLIQFKSGYTTYPYEYIEAYDTGRELAHRVTRRRYES